MHAGQRAGGAKVAAVVAPQLDRPPRQWDDPGTRTSALSALDSLGPAAAGEAPRLLALLTGPDGRPAPETLVDQGVKGFQLPVTLALAQIAPAHPALPGLVFPVIPPPPPPDLPDDFEELGLDDPSADAGLTRWTARWEAIERPLSAACKVLRAMGERAAPATARLLPHLERYRYRRPNRDLLGAPGTIRPLPGGRCRRWPGSATARFCGSTGRPCCRTSPAPSPTPPAPRNRCVTIRTRRCGS